MKQTKPKPTSTRASKEQEVDNEPDKTNLWRKNLGAFFCEVFCQFLFGALVGRWLLQRQMAVSMANAMCKCTSKCDDSFSYVHHWAMIALNDLVCIGIVIKFLKLFLSNPPVPGGTTSSSTPKTTSLPDAARPANAPKVRKSCTCNYKTKCTTSNSAPTLAKLKPRFSNPIFALQEMLKKIEKGRAELAAERSVWMARMGKVNAELKKRDAGLEKVEADLDELEAGLNRVEADLDELGADLDVVEASLGELEADLGEVTGLKWT